MRRNVLCFVVASAVAFGFAANGCSNEPPVEKPQVKLPPQLTADAATVTAMKDARFADFRRLVRELRAASKAMSDYLASIGGKPKSDGERARYAELDSEIGAKRAAVNAALTDASRTDDDRKVMRILFAAPDSTLAE